MGPFFRAIRIAKISDTTTTLTTRKEFFMVVVLLFQDSKNEDLLPARTFGFAKYLIL